MRVNKTTCLVALMLVGCTLPSAALRKKATWNKTTKAQPDAEAGGWYINLGITGARAKITEEAPKVLELAYVFEKTPAAGKLQVGDKITGVNGTPFSVAHKFGYGVDLFGYEGPMMEFGNALEHAQSKLGGTLKLDIVREGKTQKVTLELGKKYGAFSKTFPYDCQKTDQILAEQYAYLLEKQKADGSWHGRPHLNAFAALALLGSDKKEHQAAAKKAMLYFAKSTNDTISYGGLDCWKYSLYGICLAEYYLLTKEKWVIAELEEINRWLSKAQMKNGGWGHRPADRPGGNGYGAINILTSQAKAAWALMMRCGINVDAERFKATHDFVQRGTNAFGYVWYKDGGKKNMKYADMGRTGISAIAYQINPNENKAYKAAAKLNATCIGDHPKTLTDTHGSPLLGMAWTALGALADDSSFRKLMDHNRWHFALAHCTDGTFYYQPNRDNNPQDYGAGPRLSATATNALILSVKFKKLQITGAKPRQLTQ